ncbi:HTH-type transcriptional regulator GbpR [Ditylenchus destructor]|uniref:HTH-type transcriptional regulator GbpR n=1 Tax=Ditylenchus destructor TaxID=166010 RepID=A0AAD4MEE2_9BILA|nr:HTH-type transcriptional regulator GbpR [Ditylenchus destructor]
MSPVLPRWPAARCAARPGASRRGTVLRRPRQRPGAAEHEVVDRARMMQRQCLRDAPAEGRAEHVRALEAQRLDEPLCIVGKIGQGRWALRALGLAAVALVVGDHGEVLRQMRHQRREHLARSFGAMHEQQRRAFALALEGDAQFAGLHEAGRAGRAERAGGSPSRDRRLGERDALCMKVRAHLGKPMGAERDVVDVAGDGLDRLVGRREMRVEVHDRLAVRVQPGAGRGNLRPRADRQSGRDGHPARGSERQHADAQHLLRQPVLARAEDVEGGEAGPPPHQRHVDHAAQAVFAHLLEVVEVAREHVLALADEHAAAHEEGFAPRRERLALRAVHRKARRLRRIEAAQQDLARRVAIGRHVLLDAEDAAGATCSRRWSISRIASPASCASASESRKAAVMAVPAATVEVVFSAVVGSITVELWPCPPPATPPPNCSARCSPPQAAPAFAAAGHRPAPHARPRRRRDAAEPAGDHQGAARGGRHLRQHAFRADQQRAGAHGRGRGGAALCAALARRTRGDRARAHLARGGARRPPSAGLHAAGAPAVDVGRAHAPARPHAAHFVDGARRHHRRTGREPHRARARLRHRPLLRRRRDRLVQEAIHEQEPCLVVGAKNVRRLSRGPLDWARLAQLDWILPPPNTPMRRTYNAIFVGAGVQPPLPILETTSIRSIETALRQEPNAITIFARDVVAGMEGAGHLAALPHRLSWNLPPVSFFTLKELEAHPTVQSLRAAVVETRGA